MISTTKEAIKYAILFHGGISRTVNLYKLRNRLKGMKIAAVIREHIVSHRYPNPLSDQEKKQRQTAY